MACAKACNGGGVFVSGRELQVAERSLQDCLARLGPHDGLVRWKTVIFSPRFHKSYLLCSSTQASPGSQAALLP